MVSSGMTLAPTIRCVRLWTGVDGHSCFEEGTIDLSGGARGDVLSDKALVSSISFRETGTGGAYAPHSAPTRQFVISLFGTIEVTTGPGASVVMKPGDIMLAEDTQGTGHSWRLLGTEPWRRAYVLLADGAAVPFKVAGPERER